MDHRFRSHHPGLGIDGANGLGAGDCGPDQLLLQFAAASGDTGIDLAFITARPGPVGHLVYRAVEAGAARAFPDKDGNSLAEPRKALDKIGRPDIHMVRPAIMAEVPDDLHVMNPGRIQHRCDA
jgi:hypothetical protein